MKRVFSFAIVCAFAAGAFAQDAVVSVEVNPAAVYQTILGWGKTTPWMSAEPLVRQQCIDMAVNDFGINRLRFEGMCGNMIGKRSWEWLNDNDDPNVINWDAFNTELLDKRAEEWLVPWKKAVEARGEPFELYFSPSFFKGGSSGDLPPWMHADPQEYAEWMLTALLRLRDMHGIEPQYLCICNEAGNNNVFSPQFSIKMLKALMPRLRQHGFKTMVQYPESVNAAVAMRYLEAAQNDPEIWRWIGLVSYHWYGTNQDYLVKLRNFAEERNLPTAQTEYMNLTIDHLYDDMVSGGVSFWEIYGLATCDYRAALTHVSSDTFNGGRWYWRFRQVSHYVRPGARRIGCTSSDAGIRCLAFEREGKRVVVLINTQPPHRAHTVKVSGLLPGSYGVSRCVALAPTEELGVRQVGQDGTLEVEVERDSVVTLYARDAGNRPPAVLEWLSQPHFLKYPAADINLRCSATDPEKDKLQYAWSVVLQPAGATAKIQRPNQAATPVTDITQPGEYVFRVEVNDGQNVVGRDVLVRSFRGNQPPAIAEVHNRRPVWVQIKDGGTLLRANAWDIENDPLQYRWEVLRQPDAAAAQLETPDKPACQVRGMTIPGDYVFRLNVSDGNKRISAEHTVPVYE